jgi:hypothetical protein
VLRIRPKAMTVATIFAGLLPIMLLGGVGSEVMRRIAAPMVGGMITAPLLSLFVIPAVYLLWRQPCHFQHQRERRVAFSGQRLAQPLAAHTDLARQGAEVARAGNVAQRVANQRSISGVFLDAGFQIQADVFLGLQVIRTVPTRKCLGHCSALQFSCQRLRARDVPCLRGLIAATQQQDDRRAWRMKYSR